MPMGIVADDLFEEELKKLERGGGNEVSGSVEKMYKGGRRPGDVETPESLRKIIGENAIEEGSGATKEMTRELGISDSSLSAYKNGSTSTSSYNERAPGLNKYMTRTKERISKRASKTLNLALEHITENKLVHADPRDLSIIARNMGAIIKNMEPAQEAERSASNNQQLVIYAPIMNKEEKFEVIHVNE